MRTDATWGQHRGNTETKTAWHGNVAAAARFCLKHFTSIGFARNSPSGVKPGGQSDFKSFGGVFWQYLGMSINPRKLRLSQKNRFPRVPAMSRIFLARLHRNYTRSKWLVTIYPEYRGRQPEAGLRTTGYDEETPNAHLSRSIGSKFCPKLRLSDALCRQESNRCHSAPEILRPNGGWGGPVARQAHNLKS